MTKQQQQAAAQAAHIRHRHRCRRRVCLFGLSGDPPTGTGGHVGIVKRLSQLVVTNGDVDSDNNDNNNNSDIPAFDEIRILPVYRHAFVVSCFKNIVIIHDRPVAIEPKRLTELN